MSLCLDVIIVLARVRLSELSPSIVRPIFVIGSHWCGVVNLWLTREPLSSCFVLDHRSWWKYLRLAVFGLTVFALRMAIIWTRLCPFE